jgi:dipeptidyl aminopeptidase/acylaminoacyl peptidase
VWLFQDRLAFPGPNSPATSPADAGIPEGETVTLLADDGVVLRGWYLPPNPASTPLYPGVIWFYGNMETVHDLAATIRWLRPPGMGLLIMDYHGYGQSEGKATEQGLYRDAEAAWTFMVERPEIDTTRIGVYGRSLGSSVGLYLATERPVRAIALDSPFTSGRDMAAEHYRFLPRHLLRLELDNAKRVRLLRIPLLVFHGTEDVIAPYWMGKTIAEAGRAEELVAIEGAGHNDTYLMGGNAYRDRLHAFWREHLGGSEP